MEIVIPVARIRNHTFREQGPESDALKSLTVETLRGFVLILRAVRCP
jgi:hypothetical protein